MRVHTARYKRCLLYYFHRYPHICSRRNPSEKSLRKLYLIRPSDLRTADRIENIVFTLVYVSPFQFRFPLRIIYYM